MSESELNEAAEIYRTADSHSPYAKIAEDIYRERILRARAASPENKILAGQRLFDAACEITLIGIRHEFPAYSEEQCREVLRDRLAMRRKQEAQL